VNSRRGNGLAQMGYIAARVEVPGSIPGGPILFLILLARPFRNVAFLT